MRIFVMTAVAVVGMACSSAPSAVLVVEETRVQDGQSEQAALDILGQRFVDALKEENIVAFGQCWLPAGMMPVMLGQLQLPPDVPMPTPEQMKSAMSGMVPRDREIADDFPKVMEAFRGISADLSGMELVSITADIGERDGVKQTSSFDLTVRMDEETTIQFYLDDGMMVNGVWYVTDTGLSSITVTRGGETSTVLVGETEDRQGEQEALDILGHRFVDALREESIVAYSQCWLPAGIYPAMLQQLELPPGVPMPTPEDIDGVKQQVVESDRELADYFPKVITTLRGINADLSGMELVSIAAEIGEQGGFTMTSSFDLTVRMDEETTIQFYLDDGMMFNGVWYVTETGLSSITVTRGSETSTVSVGGD